MIEMWAIDILKLRLETNILRAFSKAKKYVMLEASWLKEHEYICTKKSTYDLKNPPNKEKRRHQHLIIVILTRIVS